jgi:undecaprenyl pyrophosphate phosphatase UppP
MLYLTSLGWLMALPIAAGILTGRFLDNRLHSGNFWTLALLGVGISVAAVEAYLAIKRALQRHDHG